MVMCVHKSECSGLKGISLYPIHMHITQNNNKNKQKQKHKNNIKSRITKINTSCK
jgi:hypothetical protein